MRKALAAVIVAGLGLAGVCRAQDSGLNLPQQVVAGDTLSIPTSGSGDATFYLVGPGALVKKPVQLGNAIKLQVDDVSTSGRYVAILCAETCRSEHFFVTPAAVSTVSFLVHPSRVPVGRNDAIGGVAFPFDNFGNLILKPVMVNFRLTANKAPMLSRSVPTRMGVAWFRTNSGGRGGIAQASASVNDVTAQRVLQLVPSEPCNLRITAQPTARGIEVETDPVHDCSGNTVPDGTIVTFTAKNSAGRSTVDAPIKQGVARATLATSGETVISAASGVVMGNELRMDVKR